MPMHPCSIFWQHLLSTFIYLHKQIWTLAPSCGTKTKHEIHVRFCLTLFPKSQKISRNRPSTSSFDLVSIFEPDVFKFDLTIYQKSNSEEKTWKIEKRSKTIAFSIPQESKFRTKVPLSICPPQPVQLPPSRMRRSPRSGLNKWDSIYIYIYI